MSDDRGQLAAIDWQEFFPWTNLGLALRLALQPRVLVLAALALVGTVAGWRVCGAACGRIFLPAQALPADAEGTALALPPEETHAPPVADQQHFTETLGRMQAWPWEPTPSLIGGATLSTLPLGFSLADNPIVRARNLLAAPFIGLFDPGASLGEFVFLLACACGNLWFGPFLARPSLGLPPSAWPARSGLLGAR